METPDARRDIVVGGIVLLVGNIFGWILNLGYRLVVVERLFRDERPYYPGFAPWKTTFRRGCVAFAAISAYLSPSTALGLIAFYLKTRGYDSEHWLFAALSGSLFVLAVFTLPGGMTVYAAEGKTRVLCSPPLAFSRAWKRRRIYAKAWAISLASIVVSFAGILLLGIGFAFTSVWAWEVVGYAFTTALYADEDGLHSSVNSLIQV